MRGKIKKGDIGMTGSSSGRVAGRKKRFFLVDFLIRLVKEKPMGAVGAVITVLLLLTGIFADFLAPYGYAQLIRGAVLAPPSAQFLLGADNFGRDMLSRVIFGARVSVIVGLSATAISMVVSIVLGGLSGYFGGKFDLIVQRFVDDCINFDSR